MWMIMWVLLWILPGTLRSAEACSVQAPSWLHVSFPASRLETSSAQRRSAPMADQYQTPQESQVESVAAQLQELRELIDRQQAQITALRSEMATRTEGAAVQPDAPAITESADPRPELPRLVAR